MQLRLDGYMPGKAGWERWPNLGDGKFHGMDARGFVERDLEALYRVSAMLPPFDDEFVLMRFSDLWLGPPPARLVWSEGMEATSVLLWPTSDGSFHAAQLFRVAWGERGCTHAHATMHDLEGRAGRAVSQALDVLGRGVQFEAVLALVGATPARRSMPSSGRNIAREAARLSMILEEGHRGEDVASSVPML